jgi:hypothetical protein
MPTISQFYGITIRMYFDDHPPPHFHAYYGVMPRKSTSTHCRSARENFAGARLAWF